MLGWFWRHMGRRSRGSMGAMLGGVDEIFHPEAARAREQVDRQHSMVMPMPSPGDKLLNEGRLVIERPAEE
jgi:hypothetical protein